MYILFSVTIEFLVKFTMFIFLFFFLQILEVNGQNFENVQLSKANEILKNNTHLSITVKTNLLGKVIGNENVLAFYEIWPWVLLSNLDSVSLSHSV